MRLHRSQLPSLSQRIIKDLVDGGHVEVTSSLEAARDVESVIANYLNQEREAGEQARDIVQQRGLPQGEFGRAKRLVADRLGIKVGDDALDYLLDQLVEMLMHSVNIEEVYAEDHQLRLCMRSYIAEGEEADSRLEAEVRAKLRHVKEGSRTWEIEYQRMKADIKRRRGI